MPVPMDESKRCVDRAQAGQAIRQRLESELADPWNPHEQSEPPAIPDHQLLQRIGGGAYGEVWLARNALGGLRAVKIIYRARFDNERPYLREFAGILKYEPLSRSHEGLLAVLHVGRNDAAGYFYYVMELADNALRRPPLEGNPAGSNEKSAPPQYQPRNLRLELRQRGRLSPPEAARLTLGLAGALAHLHGHGLVHRDIKPSNVIFVAGRPKLADIGLVAAAGDSRSFVGTEGFIPPEGPGTAQADVYSLGKLLYELATGNDRMDFPQLPPKVAALPEGEALLDLNEVLTRACAPRPADRYASVAEMEAELNLFLAGRSLREARRLEWRLSWFERLAVAAGVCLVAAVAALWLSAWHTRQERQRARATARQLRVETALRNQAQTAEQQARAELYTALLEQARAMVRSGELGQRVLALDAIRRAGAISNTPALRTEALAAMNLPDLQLVKRLPEDSGSTFSILSPDFQRLAVCCGAGPVEIRAVVDHRLLMSLPASVEQSAFECWWSPDGRVLAVKRDFKRDGQRADVELWELADARLLHRFRERAWCWLSFHPTRPWVLLPLEGSTVELSDYQGRPLKRFELGGISSRLDFSPDGQYFAAALVDQTGWRVAIYSSGTGELKLSHGFSARIGALAWRPSGHSVAVTDYSGTVSLLDTRNGQVQLLGHHGRQAVTARFSPDGRYLLTGGWERELILWDVQKQSRALTIPLNSFRAQFNKDGTQCALRVGSRIQLYSLERPAVCRVLESQGRMLSKVVFSPNGHWLAAADADRLSVWSLAKGSPAARATQGAGDRLVFSPDSTELFACGDETCLRWKLLPGRQTGEPPLLQPLPAPDLGGFPSLCLASNRLVLTGSQGSKYWGLNASAFPGSGWAGTLDGVSGASPDGAWLAVFEPFTSDLIVYHLPEFAPAVRLGLPSNISGFAFATSDDELLVYSAHGVQRWNTATWKSEQWLPHYCGALPTANPKECWLTRDFSHASLYDVRTNNPLLPLPRGVLPQAISPDGKLLAVTVDGEQLQLWDLRQLRAWLRQLGIDWRGA
jgi:WD40 repeat protein